MKKSIFVAIGMAVVLFLYGYVLSTAGHDHSKHRESDHKHEQHAH